MSFDKKAELMISKIDLSHQEKDKLYARAEDLEKRLKLRLKIDENSDQERQKQRDEIKIELGIDPPATVAYGSSLTYNEREEVMARKPYLIVKSYGQETKVKSVHTGGGDNNNFDQRHFWYIDNISFKGELEAVAAANLVNFAKANFPDTNFKVSGVGIIKIDKFMGKVFLDNKKGDDKKWEYTQYGLNADFKTFNTVYNHKVENTREIYKFAAYLTKAVKTNQDK